MQKVKATKVKFTIFDKAVISRGVFGKARISWKGDNNGSIVKRDARGRFQSTPFVIVGAR